MSNKVYDVLKKVCMVWIPAAFTLYGAIAEIWDIPFMKEIMLTGTAIETFLGVILGISSRNYYKKLKEENKN